METIHTCSLPEFSNFDQVSQDIDLDEQQKTDNAELIEQEIESLKSILNDTECQIVEPESNLDVNSAPYIKNINSLLKFSLIPACSKTFTLIDAPKDISVNLRCLPALELVMVIPHSYPSTHRPLLHLNTPFY